MWLECIRYRFQLDPDQDGVELARAAALESLRHSLRCRSWRVLPSPDDPALSILEIEWDPGPALVSFRGSEEFAALHAALTAQVRALDEPDYRANERLVQRALGGEGATFRLTEDIVARVMRDPELAGRFHSRDGSRRARLGLWLLQVLGGPQLFSSSFPDAVLSAGPLLGEPLDLDERERFLELARQTLPASAAEPGSGALSALRAHLPLHPEPLSPPALLPPAPLPPAARAELEEASPGAELGPGLLLDADEELVLLAELEETHTPERERELPAGAVERGVRGARSADREGARAPESGERPTLTRRRGGRRHQAFDSGVFAQPRHRTAKR